MEATEKMKKIMESYQTSPYYLKNGVNDYEQYYFVFEEKKDDGTINELTVCFPGDLHAEYEWEYASYTFIGDVAVQQVFTQNFQDLPNHFQELADPAEKMMRLRKITSQNS